VDKNQIITKTHVEKESIETRIIEYNTMDFKKAHQSITYKDKIYNKLRRDVV